VNVLADSGLVRALHAGLPLRFRFTVELWRDRFVDALTDRSEWTIVLDHEPLSDRYRLQRSWDRDRPIWYASLDSARAAVEVWYVSPLAPPTAASGRYYYDARLEVDALTVDDLAELEGWLRGDLGPAVRGETGLPGAVARGVRSVFIALVGLSTKRYEARSPPFRP
jgi:hypothetical protein